jgi:two-component system capsular synthesis response regulator RcsB
MSKKIHVMILDDHQSIVDGYRYRLSLIPQIEVIAALIHGETLEPTLARQPADVLLLDVHVPTGPGNPHPYPILHLIPRLLQVYPALNILVISMIAERGLIRAVMDAGASGYLLKDDQESIQDLGSIILTIAGGGVHFSPQAQELLLRSQNHTDGEGLTPRQVTVLSLCLAYPDDSTVELAARMVVAHSTVRNLLSGAYLKLGVHTRIAAIAKARQLGLITPEQTGYLGSSGTPE